MSAPVTITIDADDPRAAKVLRAIATALEGPSEQTTAPQGPPPIPRKKERQRRHQKVIPPDASELPDAQVHSLIEHRLNADAASKGHVSK